jgi:SAM-dependent methyltransferase
MSKLTATGTMHQVPCKVCAHTAPLLCVLPDPYSSIGHIHIQRCASCGLVFVGDNVTDELLMQAYASLDSEAYYRETEKELVRKMTRSAADLCQFGGAEQRIIDIGTGDGTFLRVLRETGFTHIEGHEIPGTDINVPGTHIYYDFNYDSIPSKNFDIVTLLDVAEHIQDIQHLFRTCYRILDAGGVVYLHTPCISRLDRIAHAMFTTPWIPSAIATVWQRSRTSLFHLQIYTVQALTTVLQESGFTDVQVRVENELSWPVARYIQIYICDRLGLSRALAPILVPFFYPLIGTDFMNANKAIVSARKGSSTNPESEEDATI